MKSKCIYVHCLTAMDGLRFKEHIAAGHCNGQQTKPRTSEEMDGTLPRIASFENTQQGAPITPQGWMGVDFLEHELL